MLQCVASRIWIPTYMQAWLGQLPKEAQAIWLPTDDLAVSEDWQGTPMNGDHQRCWLHA